MPRERGFGTDTTELRSFARRIRLTAPVEVKREVRRGMRAGGELVKEEAKSIVSQYSTTIPATLKVRTTGASVVVEAGSKDVPLARLFEMGNKRGNVQSPAREGEKFRHPVFGHEVWAEEDTHPFLAPAMHKRGPEAVVLVKAALAEGIRKGLR